MYYYYNTYFSNALKSWKNTENEAASGAQSLMTSSRIGQQLCLANEGATLSLVC